MTMSSVVFDSPLSVAHPEWVDASKVASRLAAHLGAPLPSEWNWDRTLLAGGWVAGALLAEYARPEYRALYRHSDLDIWLYGMTDEEYAIRVTEIMSSWPEAQVTVNPARPIVNINARGVEIQLLHVPQCQTAQDVLHRFDLSHCMVGYDGTELVISEEAREHQGTMTSTLVRENTLLRRVKKTLARGWSISLDPSARAAPSRPDTDEYVMDEHHLRGPLLLSVYEDPGYVEPQVQYITIDRKSALASNYYRLIDGYNSRPVSPRLAMLYFRILRGLLPTNAFRCPPSKSGRICMMCRQTPQWPCLDRTGSVRCAMCVDDHRDLAMVSHSIYGNGVLRTQPNRS